MHRLEITSFRFMFDWVPDPVWNTYSGNSLSSAPEITSSHTRPISRPFQAGGRAAAGLERPADRAGVRRGDLRGAGQRVPAVRVPDRVGDPVEHEPERGDLQPVHPADGRDARVADPGAPERSREHGPVEQ